MKCEICNKEATLKDYADIYFCSHEHLKISWIKNIDSVIDYYKFTDEIQEVEHE